jgi:hypothetical protein
MDSQMAAVGMGTARDIRRRHCCGRCARLGWRRNRHRHSGNDHDEADDHDHIVDDDHDTGLARWILWRDGVTTYLDPLPDTFGSRAEDINNPGVVVGSSVVGVLSDFAVRWRKGSVEALSSERGAARAISHHGSITGSHFGSWGVHGFLWRQGEFIEIAPPPGAVVIQPWGINDRMQIVGDTGFDAFVWQLAGSPCSHGWSRRPAQATSTTVVKSSDPARPVRMV